MLRPALWLAWGTVFLTVSPALALGLSAEIEKGSSLSEETISADGDIGGGKRHEAEWSWNASADLTQTKTQDAKGNDIPDRTTALDGGFSWLGKNLFGASVGLQYSNTPEEGLSSTGGTVSVSYKWKYFEHAKDQDEDAYQPSLTLKLLAGSMTEQQKLSTQARRTGLVRPTTGKNEIKQTFWGANLAWRMIQSLRLSAGATFYKYDRNVAQFESYLDSPAGLQQGGGGFSNAVGGLPEVTYSAGLVYELTEAWTIHLSESVSTLAADQSQSTTTKGIFDVELGEVWTVSFGAEGVHSNSLTDTLAIVGVEWDFD